VISLVLDDKGQGSIEILFITLIVFIIFAMFVGVINTASDKSQTASLGEARMQGEKIAEAINSVYIHGSGYAINITIPPSPNITARVNTPPGNVTVIYQGKSIPIKLIPYSIQTYDITSDPQGLVNVIYTIKNNNGTINITKN
jgi:hypothetical protein